MLQQPNMKPTSRELMYREKYYHDIRAVDDEQILCVACGKGLSVKEGQIFSHPVIGTLQCKKCKEHYDEMGFSSDDNNLDKYCRICGSNKGLYLCGQPNCPYAFCRKCIKRNVNSSLLDAEGDDWKCFICDPKPLWELRAICAAVINRPKKDSKNVTSRFRTELPTKRQELARTKSTLKNLKSLCDDEDDSLDEGRPSFYIRTTNKKKVTKGRKNIDVTNQSIQKNESLPQGKQKLFTLSSSSTINSASEDEVSIQSRTKGKSWNREKTHKNTDDQEYGRINSRKQCEVLDGEIHKRRKRKESGVVRDLSHEHSSESESSECNISKPLQKRKKGYRSDTETDNEDDNKGNIRKRYRHSNPSLQKEKKDLKKDSVQMTDVKRRGKGRVTSILKNDSTDSEKSADGLSSGKEFQTSKLLPTSCKYVRRLSTTEDHSKSSMLKLEKMNEHNCCIDKQQSTYFKSRVMEVLDNLNDLSTVFQTDIQNIKLKYSQNELVNPETAEYVILKINKTIDKLRMTFDERQRSLASFYTSWCEDCKVKNVSTNKVGIPINETTSTDSDANIETTNIHKVDSAQNRVEKRTEEESQKNSKKNADIAESSKIEGEVSECDTEEIFSDKEAMKEKRNTEVKANSVTTDHSDMESDERIVISKNQSTVTTPNGTLSPVLGAAKEKGSINYELPKVQLTRITDSPAFLDLLSNNKTRSITRSETNGKCNDEDTCIGQTDDETKPVSQKSRSLISTPSCPSPNKKDDSLTDIFESSFDAEDITNKSDASLSETEMKKNSTMKENDKIVTTGQVHKGDLSVEKQLAVDDTERGKETLVTAPQDDEDGNENYDGDAGIVSTSEGDSELNASNNTANKNGDSVEPQEHVVLSATANTDEEGASININDNAGIEADADAAANAKAERQAKMSLLQDSDDEISDSQINKEDVRPDAVQDLASDKDNIFNNDSDICSSCSTEILCDSPNSENGKCGTNETVKQKVVEKEVIEKDSLGNSYIEQRSESDETKEDLDKSAPLCSDSRDTTAPPCNNKVETDQSEVESLSTGDSENKQAKEALLMSSNSESSYSDQGAKSDKGKADRGEDKLELRSDSDNTGSKQKKSHIQEAKVRSSKSKENVNVKQPLLSSLQSDCSSSDEESISKKFFVSTKKDKQDKRLSRRRDNNEGSDNSVGSRVKRRRLNLYKNVHYKADKKLRMSCRVVIERMAESVLCRYEQALEKSRRHQDRKSLKSLISLDQLERKHKKCSNTSDSSESNGISLKSVRDSRRRKGKANVSVKHSLMDHLKKVENGEVLQSIDENSDSAESNSTSKVHTFSTPTEDLLAQADKIARDMLLNSDSNAEQASSNDDISVEDADKEGKKKKPANTVPKDKTKQNQEDEEKAAKSSWKRDKLLTMKFSDSDSDDEEEKWNKSQERLRKKTEDAEEEDKENCDTKPKTAKCKRKPRRRILNSDSDSKIPESDDSFALSESEKSSSESKTEDAQKKEKLKRRKRGNQKSSESDSSSQGKKKPKRRRIKKMASDSDEDSDSLVNSQGTPGKSGRKNIRKVLKDKQVADGTKQAAKEEEERLKRIADRQKLYNEMYEIRLAGEEKVEKLVLDFDPNTKEELITVHENLVKRLKPHQARGIKFMWDACFESVERIKTTSGSGCILAHCMGLGKTLQVITLAHTLLNHEATGIKTIMVVCPLSTVLNWVNEFGYWLKDIDNGDIEIYELTKSKKNFERKYQLQNWQRTGGVLIIGYEMFRNLSGSKNMRKTMKEAISQCLIDPGPDLIVCDEGHLLKNEDTALSKCIRQVKTLRRIVLTGTPLQNNLIEYHCMVQFVKPNLLGTKKEFLNRFANPIRNGQFDDSTAYDVKLMKKRAHVLHKMLEGSVQRYDYSVLTPFLPPKQEYVIFVRLTEVQIKMYQYYLDNFARRYKGVGGSLFADFQELQRIWTHPIVLRLNAEKVEKANERKLLSSDSEGSLKDFIDDGSSSDSTSSSNSNDSDVQSIHSNEAAASKRRTRNNPGNESTPEPEVQEKGEDKWWEQFVKPEHFENMRTSAKLVLLFAILKESEQIGDKVLVFSQSLYSLSLIEEFLNRIDDETQKGETPDSLEGHSGSWSLGLDYFRLDGQTSAENRSQWCKIFNRPTNTRARLFLISTRAGGLGINLTAANRVIIFDASWNPSHDVQSIYRIYRFGQKKPCYVYRFLAAGTMEEKIYIRQVTKLSLSCRVVDEQQIERHYSNNDLNELYKFEPYETAERPTVMLPKDRLLAEIFHVYKDIVDNCHEHDSLLENKAEEELDEEERKQAWLEYEEEKKGRPQQLPAVMTNYQNNIAMQQFPALYTRNDYESLQQLIRKDYPNATPEQQVAMTTRAFMEMYSYWEKQAMLQPARMQTGVQQRLVPNPVNTAVLQDYQYATARQQVQPQMNYPIQNMNQPSTHRNTTPHVSYGNITAQPVDDDIVEVPTTTRNIVAPQQINPTQSTSKGQEE